jgi:hypothetical protein
MSPIPEAPISIVASALLNNITIKVLVAITIIPVIAVIIHYASPQRLTDILLADMAKAKKTYLEAHAADTTGISASEMAKLHKCASSLPHLCIALIFQPSARQSATQGLRHPCRDPPQLSFTLEDLSRILQGSYPHCAWLHLESSGS